MKPVPRGCEALDSHPASTARGRDRFLLRRESPGAVLVAARIPARGSAFAPARRFRACARPRSTPSRPTRPGSAWIGTALADLLRTELGAGESLRVISAGEAARVPLARVAVERGQIGRGEAEARAAGYRRFELEARLARAHLERSPRARRRALGPVADGAEALGLLRMARRARAPAAS